MVFLNKRMVLWLTNLFLLVGIGTTVVNYSTSLIEGAAEDTNFVLVDFVNSATTTSYFIMNSNSVGTGTTALINHTKSKDHNGALLIQSFILGVSINDAESRAGNTIDGPGTLNNSLKLGGTKRTGSITYSLLYYVSKVEVSWYPWAANTSQLSIGGKLTSVGGALALNTQTLILDSPTKDLTISSVLNGDRRAIIVSMKLYHHCLS